MSELVDEIYQRTWQPLYYPIHMQHFPRVLSSMIIWRGKPFWSHPYLHMPWPASNHSTQLFPREERAARVLFVRKYWQGRKDQGCKGHRDAAVTLTLAISHMCENLLWNMCKIPVCVQKVWTPGVLPSTGWLAVYVPSAPRQRFGTQVHRRCTGPFRSQPTKWKALLSEYTTPRFT